MSTLDFQAILYHKQATSARTRFVRFGDITVFVFGPVEALAQIDENARHKMLIHPTAALRQTERTLGLPAEMLSAETEFLHAVDVPGKCIPVLLARIDTIDPPCEVIEKVDGRFIDLTQARGLPPIELQLLRHAYELILGG